MLSYTNKLISLDLQQWNNKIFITPRKTTELIKYASSPTFGIFIKKMYIRKCHAKFGIEIIVFFLHIWGAEYMVKKYDYFLYQSNVVYAFIVIQVA